MNEPAIKRFSGRIAIIALCAFLAIAALALLLLPVGIERGLEKWFLDKHFTHVDIDDVDFNPFTATLVVKNLTATGSEAGLIELETLRLKFRWVPLVRQRFYIVGLSLRRGTIDLFQKPAGWVLGGLLLVSGHDDQTGERSDAWQWGLNHIGLRDITIRFSGYDIEETITVNEVNIKTFYPWEEDKPASFQARVDINKGRIEMDGTIRQSSRTVDVTASIQIEELSLGRLAPFLLKEGVSSFTTVLGGTIDLRGEMEPDTGNGVINIKGRTTLNKLGAELPLKGDAIILEQDDLSLQGEVTAVIKEKTLGAAAGTLNVTASGFSMKETKDSKTIAAMERVVAGDISFDTAGGITVSETRVDGMRLFERNRSGNDEKKAPPYILTIEALSVRNIDIRESRYAAEDTTFSNVRGWITRDKDGAVDISRWIQAIGAMTDSSGGKESSQKGGVRIGSLKITNNSGLVYLDHAVSPSFIARFSSLSLNAGALDTERPRTAVPVKLSATLDKYTGIHIQGAVSPGNDDLLTMKLEGKVTALDLPRLNPYLVASSPYRMKSGHLNADVNWNVKRSVIDSEAVIVITKLDLERVEKDEKTGVLEPLLGMPLDTAVSSLRDSDGVIRLKIPIRGDIRNPDFNFSNVIAKATASALKSGLLSYYAPLGITILTGTVLPPGSLWLAERFIKFATHVRFKPVEFQPMGKALSPDAAQYLNEVVSRLTGKPDIRIVLCGIATMSDLEAQRTGASGTRQGTPKTGEPPGEKEKTRLIDLARQRADVVMDFLAGYGIAAERLHLCEPGIDTGSNARPRVEIAI